MNKGGWGMLFLVKSPEHSVQCGQVTHKSPMIKWANMLNEPSKKKFTEAKHSLSQQRQLVHCYRWVSRTLT